MYTITGFGGEVLGPGDTGYDDARRVWNGEIDRRPALIARCRDQYDVARALAFARTHDLPVTVRGGGHNVGGFAVADGALLIDLAELQRVEVDPLTATVRAETGLLLGGLDAATQAHGLAVPVGINSTTGLAGLTLGGGIGWLMRRHGLTIDSLLEIELVTAEGRVLTVSDEHHPDLFWAMKGAGSNFGVATAFRFRAQRVGPTVLAGPILWQLDQAPHVLRAYRDLSADFPDEVTTICSVRQAPPAPWIPAALHGRHVLQVGTCHAGDPETAEHDLAPLRRLGRPAVDALRPRPFVELQQLMDATVPRGWHYYWKSHDLSALTDGVLDAVVEWTWRITSPRSYTLLSQLGGAVARVPEDAAAYSHRAASHTVNVNAVWLTGDPQAAEHIAWARGLFDALAPYGAGVYINFVGQEGEDRIRAAYSGDKYERLVGLKTRWDPGNVFHLNQNIPPTAAAREHASAVAGVRRRAAP
jgi:FAD/FMN-containing dehydrogenase